jgi:hypothetical protein
VFGGFLDDQDTPRNSGSNISSDEDDDVNIPAIMRYDQWSEAKKLLNVLRVC